MSKLFNFLLPVLVSFNVYSGPYLSRALSPDKALISAASRGDLAGVQNALESGADINYSEGEDSALIAAICKGHAQIVRFLLERGAEVIRDSDPLVAALVSNTQNRIEVIDLLLRAGARIWDYSYVKHIPNGVIVQQQISQIMHSRRLDSDGFDVARAFESFVHRSIGYRVRLNHYTGVEYRRHLNGGFWETLGRPFAYQRWLRAESKIYPELVAVPEEILRKLQKIYEYQKEILNQRKSLDSDSELLHEINNLQITSTEFIVITNYLIKKMHEELSLAQPDYSRISNIRRMLITVANRIAKVFKHSEYYNLAGHLSDQIAESSIPEFLMLSEFLHKNFPFTNLDTQIHMKDGGMQSFIHLVLEELNHI